MHSYPLLKEDDKEEFKDYLKKCIDVSLICFKVLFNNYDDFNLVSDINKNIYVFGSSVDYLINNKIKTNRLQDLDIIMTNEKYNEVIYYLKKIGVSYYTSDKTDKININDIDENDDVYQKYSSVLLKHNGIHRIINIKFKSMIKFFTYSNSIFLKFI